MNNVNLIGRLTAEPDVRYTNSGKMVCNISLAVERSYKKSSGEKEIDFIHCNAWEKLAKIIEQYCYKGKEVGINGKLHTQKYMTKEGETRVNYFVLISEIKFLGERKKNSNNELSNLPF